MTEISQIGQAQGRIAAGAEGDPAFLAMKAAAARFYVAQIVPEAMGLKAAAMARSRIGQPSRPPR